jgi:hypothetical protein
VDTERSVVSKVLAVPAPRVARQSDPMVERSPEVK